MNVCMCLQQIHFLPTYMVIEESAQQKKYNNPMSGSVRLVASSYTAF